MKRLLAIALIIAGYSMNCHCQQMADQQYTEAFDAVWKTVQENFYDPSFLGVNWVTIGQRYEARLTEVHNDDQFAALVGQMLKELPTSHLALRRPPQKGTSGLGVVIQQVNGADTVTDVWLGSDAMLKGLEIGDTVRSPVDGLKGLFASPAQLTVKTCDGQQKTMSIRRDNYGWPFSRPPVRWQIVRPNFTLQIGYMQIQHFTDDVAPLIDQAMSELAPTSGLIIDVRNNTGGNISYVRLLSYLTAQPHMALALLSRPYLDRLGKAPAKMDAAMLARLPKVSGVYTDATIVDAFKRNGGGAAFYTEDLGTHVYHGKIVVLANQQTASAAEGFVALIKRNPNVTVIGQPTAGAVVGSESFPIPGGWSLAVPTHSAWLPDGSIYRDESTTPDIYVPLLRKDLCDHRDAALDQAFTLLER